MFPTLQVKTLRLSGDGGRAGCCGCMYTEVVAAARESEAEHLRWLWWEEGVRAGILPGEDTLFPFLSPEAPSVRVRWKWAGRRAGGNASALAGRVRQPGFS